MGYTFVNETFTNLHLPPNYKNTKMCYFIHAYFLPPGIRITTYTPDQINPFSIDFRTRSAVLTACIFRSTLTRCFSTVRMLMNSSLAI